jgi:pilus assembly protein CpaE
VDVASAPSIDADLLRGVLVEHDSKIDLLLAPPSPETAELVTKEHLTTTLEVLRGMYDYVVVDVDKRLDDLNLGVFDAAETLFVVLTADLSCLKNVRLVLETLGHIGYSGDRIKLILNRSNAFTGINAKTAEGALRRPIDLQVLNEYRGAISALNSGAPVMLTKADSPLGRSIHDVARAIDKTAVGAQVGAAAPAR